MKCPRIARFRVDAQLAEALGDDNRWYCSEVYGYKVEDEELLIEHFITAGGAEDFAQRFAEAMGNDNRWFCGERTGHEVADPEKLWKYYMKSRITHAAEVRRSQVTL